MKREYPTRFGRLRQNLIILLASWGPGTAEEFGKILQEDEQRVYASLFVLELKGLTKVDEQGVWSLNDDDDVEPWFEPDCA